MAVIYNKNGDIDYDSLNLTTGVDQLKENEDKINSLGLDVNCESNQAFACSFKFDKRYFINKETFDEARKHLNKGKHGKYIYIK